MILHPFLLFAGNEQVGRKAGGLKLKTEALVLVSMNFACLVVWFHSVPGQWAGFPGREEKQDLGGIGFGFLWKVTLVGWAGPWHIGHQIEAGVSERWLCPPSGGHSRWLHKTVAPLACGWVSGQSRAPLGKRKACFHTVLSLLLGRPYLEQ